ncbi:helix-turn-helix domain-containing protein [Streptococcus phocae subsp. salmonis]|uniref:helix-turn-helix domain-containing protein n=1 Tax=Streptococcus phocae TaxID=119224 RepID=UPI000531A8B9|nr:helix-turn-helix domain-containing protein [Streptococcus phocae]KGR72789.1 hypothetical protein NX86_04290 [Streptococcus phocae subsp. salmonis]
MLEAYIEKSVMQRIALLNVLLEFNEIPVEDVCAITSLDQKNLLGVFTDLQEQFLGELTLTFDSTTLTLTEKTERHKTYYFYQVYRTSTFLKALRFFILNPTNKMTDFTNEVFVSVASGYRIRKKCLSFLTSVGLSLEKNKVTGPEYRLRYLIAYLQYQYGIELYDLSKDLEIVKRFIVSSNDNLSLEVLDITPNECLFFGILVALVWRRKAYATDLPQVAQFDEIKQIFTYQQLVAQAREIIQPRLDIELSDEDYDFIFLAYCTTHTPLFKDKWTAVDLDNLVRIVFTHTKVKSLITKLEPILGLEVISDKDFLIDMVIMFKSFVFGLQNIVPNDNYYDYMLYRATDTFTLIIQEIAQEWRKEAQVLGEVNRYHSLQLALHLKEMLKNALPPIPVYICLNNQAILKHVASILSRNFTAKVVDIQQFNILLDKPFEASAFTNDLVIITQREYLPYFKKRYPTDKVHYIPVTLGLPSHQQYLIHQTLLKLWQTTYDNKVESIAQGLSTKNI